MAETETHSWERRRNEQNPGQTGEGEKLEVRSGYVVAIDQFMLSNSQFLGALATSKDSNTTADVVKSYGGSLWSLTNGTYRVHRDPFQTVIIVAPSVSEEEPDFDALIAEHENMTLIGKVYVDTRCVVIVDQDLLFNEELIGDYISLRRKGADKPARDLLREHGAAVRYGFSNLGDELGVYRQGDNVAMWPDVVD